MKDDYEVPLILLFKLTLKHYPNPHYQRAENKKQAAADVSFQYSKFVMACIGNQVRPCDLRMHLMKEISGMPTSLKKDTSRPVASPDLMGESSSSGTAGR